VNSQPGSQRFVQSARHVAYRVAVEIDEYVAAQDEVIPQTLPADEG